MAPLGLLAGVLCTLGGIVLILPWLRTVPGLSSLPTLPWYAGVFSLITIAVVLGAHLWLSNPDPTTRPPVIASGKTPSIAGNATSGSAQSWEDIAAALGPGTSPRGGLQGPMSPAAAQPMSGAIASLQARLARGGGSPADWELLAKSYEFLGRPADASKVRMHQLPPLPPSEVDGPASASRPAPPGPGTTLSGLVSLAPGLQSRATPGATLFIFAKSVDSPGAPVAVLRTTVGDWPAKFELNDSESMLPGRNLSTAGRVTVEARVSSSGQALPAPGDLQGASPVIDPADHTPLRIVIDKVLK